MISLPQSALFHQLELGQLPLFPLVHLQALDLLGQQQDALFVVVDVQAAVRRLPHRYALDAPVIRLVVLQVPRVPLLLDLHAAAPLEAQLAVDHVLQVERAVLDDEVGVVLLIEVVVPGGALVKLAVGDELEVGLDDGVLDVAEEGADVLRGVPVAYYFGEN